MDSRFQRKLRPIAAVTLFFFTWISIEPWNYAAWAQTSPKPKTSVSQSSKTTSGKFEESLRAAKKVVEELDQDVASGKDIALQLEALKGHKQTIEAADPEIRAEFASTEKFLKEKKLPAEILARHAKAVADYDTNYKILKTNLDSIVQLETDRKKAEDQNDRSLAQSKRNELKARIKAAKDHLTAKVKEPRHQKLDPNNLPHRTAKPTNKKPRLKKEEFKNLVGANGRSPILLAYNGDPSGLLVTQNTQDLPTPADLAETIEVQFTPDIQAKAAELEHNPVKIYNWVHNNIDFVPTYGSIQGANHCLLTKQCNDMDTASLLIALLRTSGIAARYVYGTIEVPIDQVMNWVGGFTDAQTAINFISSSGTPVAGLISGGKFSAARMEHTWVEAYVPYDQYRGAKTEGAIKAWIPMDGSFKEYAYRAGVDLFQVTGFDAENFLNELKTRSTFNDADRSVTNIDEAFISQQILDGSSRIDAYTQANMPNATVPDVLGYKSTVVREYGILLGSLPFKTISSLSRFSDVSGNLRHKMTIRASDPTVFSGQGLVYIANLPEIAGKRITISYTAATDADRAVLSQYGDLSLAPAYLVNLMPILRINGVVVAEGPAIGLGKELALILEFTDAWGSTDMIQNVRSVGGYHAIALNPSSISKSSVQNISTNFQALINAINSGDGGIFPDDLFGEMLHAVGTVYFYETDALNKVAAKLANVRKARHPSEAIASVALAVSYLFDVPKNVDVTGLNIDVDRDVSSSASLTGDKNRELAYETQSGINGSMMEHLIFNHLFQQDAISAVKVLQLANQQGIPIYQIIKTNISTLLPNLQLDSAVKMEIQNLVNAGRTVTVPKQEILYNGWAGIGYIALDPVTGSGAYIIEGGNAGGDTSGPWAIGEAASFFLGLAEMLKTEEPLPVGSLLGALAGIASVLGIASDAVDNLSQVADAKLSDDSKEMLAVLVIGLTVMLAVGAAATITGNPYGIAVTVLASAYINLIFTQVIPIIIITAETLEAGR